MSNEMKDGSFDSDMFYDAIRYLESNSQAQVEAGDKVYKIMNEAFPINEELGESVILANTFKRALLFATALYRECGYNRFATLIQLTKSMEFVDKTARKQLENELLNTLSNLLDQDEG